MSDKAATEAAHQDTGHSHVQAPSATTSSGVLRFPTRSSKRSSSSVQEKTNADRARLPHMVPRIQGELASFQVSMLSKFRRTNSASANVLQHDHEEQQQHSHGGGGGGHHEKAPSIFTAIPAAIINFLLMFGLSCAYGMIMFEDPWNARHRGLAVKMNLGSAFIVGLILSLFSEVPVAIGGPDLNPVVFLGMFVNTMSEEIANQNNLEYPAVVHRRRLAELPLALLTEPGDVFRRLASSGSSDIEFCTGTHYKDHMDQCDQYHYDLRATTVFAVSTSSLLLGIIYLGLGKLKLTRYVSFVPSNIMEAFLACVGYKVFKYALKFCKFQLRQFIPAACVGVTLYVLKASHIGNPAVVIPLMLLVPLCVFYAIVFGAGSNLQHEESYMFPTIDNIEFWKIWTDSIGTPKHVNFKAWIATLPDLPVMVVVVVLDCLLKLSSTDNKLPVKTVKDYEMTLYGISNFITCVTGCSVGYMQLKFNVINFGVMGNVKDRRGGIIYALLCGGCFFSTIELINVLPRFFLGTLLFFAGAGFIAENLWGSRKYLSRTEWLQVCIVLGVFILLNSILYAVVVGGLLVGATFIMKYANIPCVIGAPTRGASVHSIERRDLLVEKNMLHVANQWLMLVRLKGFIFFASAQNLINEINETINREAGDHMPRYRRLRYVIFDCKLLDSMDSSAAKGCSKLVEHARSKQVHILWTNVTKAWAKEVTPAGLVNSDNDWFENLEQAVSHIDRLILKEMKFLEGRWITLDPAFELIDHLASAKRHFGPLNTILSSDASRIGCPWQYCGRMSMKKSRTHLWKPEEKGAELFLVCSGRVALFPEIPEQWKEGDMEDWAPPAAVYGPGWFLNRESLHHKPTRLHAVALEDGELLFWNEHQWGMMMRERPEMASAVMKMVLRQEASEADRLRGALVSRSEKLVKDASAHGAEVDKVETTDSAHGDEPPVSTTAVPEEIEQEVRGISIARALDNLGLYAPVLERDGSLLPSLPDRMVEDLSIAFHTYATPYGEQALVANEDVNNSSSTSTHVRMPVSDARDALMYAGFFNSWLTTGAAGSENTGGFLSEAEFIALGQAAGMSRLTQDQVFILEAIFQKYKPRPDGSLSNESLVELFRDRICSSLTLPDIDGVASLWYKADNSVTAADFLALMSRFIKIHEPDWLMLTALRRIGIQESGNELGKLTADMLVKANDGTLEKTDAEEMIWNADFCGGTGQGNTLDCRLVASALMHSELPDCKLPPPPVVPPKDRRKQSSDTPRDRKRNSATNGASAAPVVTLDDFDTNDFLCDLRSTTLEQIKTMVGERTADKPVDMIRFTITDVSHRESSALMSEAGANLSWRAKLYLLLEEPGSSQAANVFSMVMGILIIVSVMSLVSEPLISPSNEPRTDQEDAIWMGFETFFTVIFTVEILLRLLVADAMGKNTQMKFLKTPMTICDICAVVPFYVEVIIKAAGGESSNDDLRLLRIVRLMRLSRVMRVGRLANRSQIFASIATMLTVIWGIYIKTGFNE